MRLKSGAPKVSVLGQSKGLVAFAVVAVEFCAMDSMTVDDSPTVRSVFLIFVFIVDSLLYIIHLFV